MFSYRTRFSLLVAIPALPWTEQIAQHLLRDIAKLVLILSRPFGQGLATDVTKAVILGCLGSQKVLDPLLPIGFDRTGNVPKLVRPSGKLLDSVLDPP